MNVSYNYYDYCQTHPNINIKFDELSKWIMEKYLPGE